MPSPLQPQTFRDKKNLWLARFSEWGHPLLRTYASAKASSASTPPKAWRKGILWGANHIGDVLYRSASLPALKKGLPDCSWYFVTTAPANEVLLNNPHIAGQIVLPATKLSLAELKAEILRQAGDLPDVAICYDSSSYWRYLLQATCLGIPNRVAYHHKGFSGLSTHPADIRYPQPFPAYFRDLTAQLTGQPADWSLRPQIFPDQHDKSETLKWMENNGLSPDIPMVACFCTSRQPTGVLPLTKFTEIFRTIKVRTGIQLILAGAKQDKAILEKVNADGALEAKILAGDLGLRSLCCLLQMCKAVVTSDSGPRHLSNASGVPVVFVRNLSFSKVEAGIYLKETEYDFAPDVEFVPPAEQEQILSSVSAPKMADQVVRILETQNR